MTVIFNTVFTVIMAPEIVIPTLFGAQHRAEKLPSAQVLLL